MTYWVFNDLHLGVRRVSGTTAEGALKLKSWLMEKFEEDLLGRVADGEHVIINGDLIDSYRIPLADLLEIYEILRSFLGTHPNSHVYLALGNHDLSKDSTQIGGVEFLGNVLYDVVDDRLHLVEQPMLVDGHIYIIPHLVNQEAFDAAIEAVPAAANYVLLHCNYDNHFAEQADHSLNLSREQALALVTAGKTLILGHEHQARDLMDDNLIIVGNQYPTSVSDCLSPRDSDGATKRCIKIEPDGITQVDTWKAEDEFGFTELSISEGPWDTTLKGFARMTGKVPAEGAYKALSALGALLREGQYFVLTNAIEVERIETDANQALQGVKDVRQIKVMDLLMDLLTEEQKQVVKEVMGGSHV